VNAILESRLVRSVETHFGRPLLIVRGDRGALAAEAYRLPSGHVFVTVWLHMEPTTEADTFCCPILHRGTISACICDVMPQHGQRRFELEVAWDRGGDDALLAAMERAYPVLLPEPR
jgi:hypothetical protein